MSLPSGEGEGGEGWGGVGCRINQRSVAAVRAKAGRFRGHRSGRAAVYQRQRRLDGWRMMRRNKVPRRGRSMTRRRAAARGRVDTPEGKVARR